MCVCVLSRRVPGCPSSIGLTLYSIPQGGPGLCASGECRGERTTTRFQIELMRIPAEESTKTERVLPHLLLDTQMRKELTLPQHMESTLFLSPQIFKDNNNTLRRCLLIQTFKTWSFCPYRAASFALCVCVPAWCTFICPVYACILMRGVCLCVFDFAFLRQ